MGSMKGRKWRLCSCCRGSGTPPCGCFGCRLRCASARTFVSVRVSRGRVLCFRVLFKTGHKTKKSQEVRCLTDLELLEGFGVCTNPLTVFLRVGSWEEVRCLWDREFAGTRETRCARNIFDYSRRLRLRRGRRSAVRSAGTPSHCPARGRPPGRP